ncbi:MAG: Clp protease N-terminal domain-containing protein, partial [Trebonia sp.]
TEQAMRGTPAVEAALQQAARLAGPLPVGSHHLLLAALDDPGSAASLALVSLGVDLDGVRERLRSAKVAGTTDEQPEQAGRRQMNIQVTDEILTIVATDPVIVAAGIAALRAVNARATQSGHAPASETVIRGDDAYAAGLANVWLELRETLGTLADPPTLFQQLRATTSPPAEPPSAQPPEKEEAGENAQDNPEADAS